MEFKNVEKPVPCYWLLEWTGQEQPQLIPDLPTPPPVIATHIIGHDFKRMPNLLIFCYLVILLYSLLTFYGHFW